MGMLLIFKLMVLAVLLLCFYLYTRYGDIIKTIIAGALCIGAGYVIFSLINTSTLV